LTVGASFNSASWWNEFGNADRDYQQLSQLMEFNSQSIAPFSAMGPTPDGRLKPDIVAPGHWIISAKASPTSDGSCDADTLSKHVTFKAGTSMAAPVSAATLALARQYFMEGFWPYGSRNRSHAFIPSGSLLKNVAIHSAQKMTGKRIDSPYPQCESASTTQSRVHSIPQNRPWFFQGWGRIQLDQALYFANSNQRRFIHIPSFSLDVPSSDFHDKSLKSLETHTYQFCVYPTKEVDIVASLTWVDPPASLLSSKQLIHDLDLVVSLDGTKRIGNGETYS
jgi:hypothetical protein